MKAIIEKQVTILQPKIGFVTGNDERIIIIKLFSLPVYRRTVIYQVKS